MAESEICVRDNHSACLLHPDYLGQVSEAWFSPEYWGKLARPVSSGGRGGAWFVDADGHQVVLRKYLRGGLMTRLSRSSYVFLGEQHVRSFAEFRLLNWLTELELPVPKPVAAWYRRMSPLHYQASIIIERIDNTAPLADLIGSLDDNGWRNLGVNLRRFHDAGVKHADLNCFNVLVRGNEFFLIDFDKGQIVQSPASAGWKSANLERFARSLRKLAGAKTQERVWYFLMNGYNGSQEA